MRPAFSSPTLLLPAVRMEGYLTYFYGSYGPTGPTVLRVLRSYGSYGCLTFSPSVSCAVGVRMAGQATYQHPYGETFGPYGT